MMTHRWLAVVRAAFLPIVAVLAGCGASSAGAEGMEEAELRRRDELLTAREQQALVAEIDGICGDTWCGGDFDFAFHSFSCKRSTRKCELKLDYIWREPDNDGIRVPHTCEFENVTDKDQVLTTQHGALTYTETLYEQITDCISDGEADARLAVDANGGDASLRPVGTAVRRVPPLTR